MTIKKKILIISSCALFLLLISILLYIQVKKQVCLNKVTEYLLEEKGYDETDIKRIESKKSRLPSYYVSVIFDNEPTIEYLYYCHDIKGQFEYNSLDGKSIPVEDLKNYDPFTMPVE